MNTRLQVEHPVTEAITGLDLVRLQLLIASGEALPAEVHAAVAAGPVGHAIETRLYAEDPGSGWMPSTGTLHRFEISTANPGVRIDSGVESGSVVSPHYDPMLAKVIVHAPTRDEAASALATTLADSRIHGVTTNRDLLVRTLRHESFRSGDTDTGFLDRFDTLTAPLADPAATRRHALAAALAAQAGRRSAARVQPNIPSGYRNSPSVLQTSTFDSAIGVVTVGYIFDRFDLTGRRLSRLEIDGTPVDVDADTAIESITPEMVTLTFEGVTRRYGVERVSTTSFVDGPDGASVLVEHDRFPDPGGHVAPGSSLAPMPGGVVRVAVAVGDEVKPGQLLVVLEAMKMEHAVHAAAAGKVSEVSVSVGDQVETGRVLVVVEGPEE
jgi:propionyl-CoA carboxylase alpha chain